MSTNPIITIVGAGPGVSLSVARRFGREGFRVVLIARDVEKLETLRVDLSAVGIETMTLSADAADEQSLVDAFSQIQGEWGTTSVLHYNAVTVHAGNPSQLKLDDLMLDFKVGVGGAMVAAQQVIPPLKRQGHGTLLFTGGGFAVQPMAGLASLGVAKAGLRNFVGSLAQEMEGSGIKVGTVTICGTVMESGPFAADKIADEFWQIHHDPLGSPVERMFVGRPEND